MTVDESHAGTENPRPYWHVDAKWVSGLLSLAALTATLLTFALFRITSESTAVPMAAEAIAAFIRPEGRSGNAASLASLRQQIEASEEGIVYPFPGVDVGVTLEDLETRSSQEVQAELFTALAETVYWTGLESMGEGSGDTAWQRVGFMALLTHETHLLVRRALFITAGLSIVGLGLLALFSHRNGRIANPGCALTLAGLPGMLALGALMEAVSRKEASAAAQGGADRIMAAALALQPAAEAALRTYMWATAVGLLLLVVALTATIVGRLRSSSSR